MAAAIPFRPLGLCLRCCALLCARPSGRPEARRQNLQILCLALFLPGLPLLPLAAVVTLNSIFCFPGPKRWLFSHQHYCPWAAWPSAENSRNEELTFCTVSLHLWRETSHQNGLPTPICLLVYAPGLPFYYVLPVKSYSLISINKSPTVMF